MPEPVDENVLTRMRNYSTETFLNVFGPVISRFLPDPWTEAGNERVAEKSAFLSRVTMTEFISPSHADTKGFAYAGPILSWCDIAAGIAAKRHANAPSVTRSVDDVQFLYPLRVGDVLTIQASVNKAWNTSMEVGIRMEAETPPAGPRRFVAHAYMTFVALSPVAPPKTGVGRLWLDSKPLTVPKVVPHSPTEHQRWEMAERRRQRRFSEKKATGEMRAQLEQIRILLREWSLGLRRQSISEADVISHPALIPPIEEEDESNEVSSPTTIDADETHTHLKVDIPKPRRRYSTASYLVPQPCEKSIELTYAEVVELVMPQHANTLQITFGGQIIQWMETCALVSARRLACTYLMTASIDSLQFIKPTHVGEVVTVRSIVSRTFKSSIEVYVSVEGEDLRTGETYFTNDAFFTIVAVDAENIPVKIPHAVPQNEVEAALYKGAGSRRERRLALRNEILAITTGHEQ
ncbi:hypothetical protein K450DRAFT_269617 [Umbelopsis ramanniana AG]|uniref:HotDog ACOT-type domain-containing protein n=1 Tax=Umbelopsis ramanniana AG TaxID=1314678 RepID=A0AAD5EH50_UMBRA|nr:uncharacterized protein K450DRAFT_269617 [Umbelopsis ramanniana AG]KAI8582160.1 hypothetical protein K450DRAFT_269617 [Umbelopsis ramanniana AG]